MTTAERCCAYAEYKNKLALLASLELAINAAKKAGDDAYHATKSADLEEAYRLADAAGWLLCDELVERKKATEAEVSAIYKSLQDNSYDLSDYYSCCAYGITDIKKVEVVLLDGTSLRGVIYPYVYDNAQEMYLQCEDGNDFDLDEGWEVKQVNFI